MLQKIFIEDMFIQFSNLLLQNNLSLSVSSAEHNAILNFHQLVVNNESLTLKQSKYMLALLSKYSKPCKDLGLDYSSNLISPKWKNEFRIIDNTKSVWVEEIDDEKWICLKIPFALKDELENIAHLNASKHGVSIWDHENKVRKLKLYDFNIIHLNEFFEKHSFEKKASFLEAVSAVEAIWDQQDNIIPRSDIDADKVILINASKEAISWFEDNKHNDISKDLMLARSMGFFYNVEKTSNNIIEKICSSTATNFWIRDLGEFFKLYKSLECKIAIITDKDNESQKWIKKFIETSANYGIFIDDIKVCFRLSKEENSDFNRWVKDAGVGGSVDSGKIFIFNNKPAKWLFSSDLDIKIIATDSLYPVPNAVTQAWMDSHPCVCYLGELRASQIKDKTIVSL